MNLIHETIHSMLNSINALGRDGDSIKKRACINSFADMLSFYRRQWNLTFDSVYEELVNLLDDPLELLTVAAMDADSRGLDLAAAHFVGVAARLSPGIHLAVLSASYLRKSGKVDKAREICRSMAISHPENQEVLSELFMCDVAEHFWSYDYYDLLARIHLDCQPSVYMEIGVATGKSLALARSGTRALGIDPALSSFTPIYHSPENTPQLYSMTSNDFFASMDLIHEMGQPGFDVAFIDGLHHFDQVLRDFINLEKYAGKNSVIIIHDCLPINSRVTELDRTTAFWTGDVWKIIPCLRAVRPDLKIVTVPAVPSGLALVSRLDGTSKILGRHYADIVGEFESLILPESWSDRFNLLAVEADEAGFSLTDNFPSAGYL